MEAQAWTEPVNITAVAQYLCERSGWKLSNLELQKILYLIQMHWMGHHEGARLLNDSFEAWDYGPVSPRVYHLVKMFGNKPIKSGAFFSVRSELDDQLRSYLDSAYDQLSKYTPTQLVAITHEPDGAWAQTYVPGVKGLKIADGAIVEEFRRRQTRTQAKAAHHA